MKLVMVEWLDAHSGRGWQTMEQLEFAAEPLYCRSVGWLFSERKDCKVIVPHLSGGKDDKTALTGCGDLTIPNRCIVKLTVLRSS
jgi:hypothetical protein